MSGYNRRDVLKTGTGAALIAGGILAGGTVGADDVAERRDVQAPTEPVTERSDGFDGDSLEHIWTYTQSFTPVSLVDGTVYTGEAVEVPGSADPVGMIALDAEDGSVLWKNEDLWDHRPTVIDDTLYLKDSGQLHALDRTDGSLRWQFDFDLDDDERALNQPVAGDGVVYVTTSNTNANGTLYALETDDGSVRWSVDIEPDDAYSAPTPVVAHDAVFLNVSGVLYAFEADDGSVRWQNEAGSRGFNGTPVVDDDHVYISKGSVYAFDPETGEEVWSIFYDMDTSIEVSATALAMKNGQTVSIYDLETREEIASVPERNPFFLGDDVVIAAKEDPERVRAIDLESGDELWELPAETDSSVTRSGYTSPRIVGDTVYFHDRRERPYKIVALDKYEGEKRWEIESGSAEDARLIVGDETILTKARSLVRGFRSASEDTDGENEDDCDCDEDGETDDESGSDSNSNESDDGDEDGNDETGDDGAGGESDEDGEGGDDDTDADDGDGTNDDSDGTDETGDDDRDETDGDGSDGADDTESDGADDTGADDGDETDDESGVNGDDDETDENEDAEETDGNESDGGPDDDGSDGSGDDGSDDIPGFGAVTGLAGAAGGAALAVRRLLSSDELTNGD